MVYFVNSDTFGMGSNGESFVLPHGCIAVEEDRDNGRVNMTVIYPGFLQEKKFWVYENQLNDQNFKKLDNNHIQVKNPSDRKKLVFLLDAMESAFNEISGRLLSVRNDAEAFASALNTAEHSCIQKFRTYTFASVLQPLFHCLVEKSLRRKA